MQKLFQPYRKTPREAKIYRETENEQFSTVIRREFLNLAAFPAENGVFLSCSLACRTRATSFSFRRVQTASSEQKLQANAPESFSTAECWKAS